MDKALLLEKWKAVPGYEGYEASNLGYVRNIKTKRVLNQRENDNNGYYEIRLHGKYRSVHRIIAKTFLSNDDDRLFVNHIDSNRHNNKITNLEWCTPKENAKHMSLQGNAKGGRQRVTFDCYYRNGRLKKHYENTAELEEDGFSYEHLRVVLNKGGRKYKGFFWKKSRTKIKAILQYDYNHNLIAYYEGGASEAAKNNADFNVYSISKAARGEWKTYKGFIWKYA